MTRYFSLPTVLRMTPKNLVRLFFDRLGHPLGDVPWDRLSPRQIQPILEAFQQLPATEQNAAEAALHNVFDLACENGLRAIHEAAEGVMGNAKDLAVPSDGGIYSTSIWTWIHYPDVFDRAMLLFEVDQLTRWRKRKGVSRVAPHTSPAILSRFAGVIGEILQREEGRGRRCTVEHVGRKNGTDFYLAYPDDFVHAVLMHDDQGGLLPRTVRQTFELVFAYTQADGTLELNAKVLSRLKPELEDIFCEIILGQPAVLRGCGAVYDLNVLKDGPDRLQTDPEDYLTAVVRRLRLSIPESREVITLEANRAGDPLSVYRMLSEYLNRERLPLADLEVAAATIGLVFHPTDRRKPGRLTFDVARPDTCTLRNHQADKVALAQKYLKRWGIAVA